jgi:hypothetical protein
MFNYVQIKKKDEGYCVLHKEDKGYYLSRVEIAKSLNFEPVETGSKKDCEYFIKNKNNGHNTEMATHFNQNQTYLDSIQDTNT